MQLTKTLSQARFLLFIIFFIITGKSGMAQERRVELQEMKDSVNLLISTIKQLEKESSPDTKKIAALRTAITMLGIYNGNKQCGTWPTPSARVQELETYWKCTFDNAPYGKKFVLRYE